MTWDGENKRHRDVQHKNKLKGTLREPMFSSNLKTTSIIENNIDFKTGLSVTFNYLRNPNRSFKHIDKTRFGQNLEPSGRYMSIDTNPKKTKEYLPELEQGTITFKNPLVLEHITTTSDPTGWKFRLSQHFGKKTGKKLSKAITDAGYDGIITVDGNHTSEIVDLTRST